MSTIRIAIDGPSGAGKSTAIDILMGLLQVQGGEILCDGRNIFENYPSWLSHIGYIPQTIYLTDDSIRENIAFGVAKEDIDDERVWHVLEEAQLKDFVKELPGMLDMEIGERGVRLSGGQRQRLTIARALVRQPEILILDDSASALDYATDAALRKAIRNMEGNPAVFIVSQRTSSIQHADRILVLDDGKAAGLGTHEELLETCPVYQEIYYSQFDEKAAKAVRENAANAGKAEKGGC